MVVANTIRIGDGNGRKVEYFYWSEYESYEEAIYYAKKIKEDRRKENMNVKYFIIEVQEGRFLPVPKFILYLNKDLKVL